METDGTVRLLSRRGTSLNAAFPDLVTAAGRQLPAGTIADDVPLDLDIQGS